VSISSIISGIKFSFSYFSTIPITIKKDEDLSQKEVISYMLISLPLVGIVVASISILSYQLLSSIGFLGAVVSAILYMILYGFLHTEAVVDVADAIYASLGGKDAYWIIKEPTIGAIGMFWGVALMIVKISAISQLFMTNHSIWLIVVALFSRLMLLFLIITNRFRSSFVNFLKEAISLKLFVITAIFYILFAYLIIGSSTLYLLLISIVTSIVLFRYISKRLGFANGDVLGATLEGAEVAMLIGSLLWL